MFRNYFFVCVAFFTILLSCSRIDDKIICPTKSLIFDSESEVQQISFTSSGSWTIIDKGKTSWCHYEDQRGMEGENQIDVSVLENDLNEDRQTTLVLQTGNYSHEISVTQKQKNFITLNDKEVEMTSDGGEIIIDVKTNVNFVIIVENNASSWIKQINKSKSSETKSCKFRILENSDYDKRIGRIHFKYGDINEIFTVTQMQKDCIILQQNNAEVTAEGGTISVDLKTNAEFQISIPEEFSSWIKWLSDSRSMEDKVCRFEIFPNDTYEDREGVIHFISGDLDEIFTVTQIQRDCIILSQNSTEASADGGTISVNLKTNAEFQISIPEEFSSWIKWLPDSRSLEDKVCRFEISPNDTYEDREGVIHFISGDLDEIFIITQIQKDGIILSQDKIEIAAEGGTVSVDVQANGAFEVNIPQEVSSWIKRIPDSRKMESNLCQFEISPNEFYEGRTGEIHFIRGKDDKIISIEQKQLDKITLDCAQFDIQSGGGNFSVHIETNMSYQLVIPESSSDWITEISDRTLQTHTHTFSVQANSTFDARIGEIKLVYGNNNDNSEIITVKQACSHQISTEQTDFEITGKEQILEIPVKCNTNYHVSNIDVEWITFSEILDGAEYQSTAKFTIQANSSGTCREGNITLSMNEGDPKYTITVRQEAIAYISDLSLSFEDYSGTIGGDLYIGRSYGLTLNYQPSDADTDFEWSISNPSIAEVQGSDSYATIYTHDFGRATIKVVDNISGKSTSYDIETCITDFLWNVNTGEEYGGYPLITIGVGEKYQLNCSYSPSYIDSIFADKGNLMFREFRSGDFIVVDKSENINVNANGEIEGLKDGYTEIRPAGNIYRDFYSDQGNRIMVRVISEYFEEEYNDEFSYADSFKFGFKMNFRLSSFNDVDIFKIKIPSGTQGQYKFKIRLNYSESSSQYLRMIHCDIYNSSYTLFSGTNFMFSKEQQMIEYEKWVDTEYVYLRFSTKDIDYQAIDNIILELIPVE